MNDTRKVQVLCLYIVHDDPIRYEIIVQGKGGKFLLGLANNIQADNIRIYGPFDDWNEWDKETRDINRESINRLEFLLGVGTTPEKAALHVIDVWNSILGEDSNE